MKNRLIHNTHVRIDRFVPGGQTIATLTDDGATDQAGTPVSLQLAGKKAFFWNALPGEIVLSYQITKSKSHYLEAIATELAEPLSPHRVAPRDDCYLATSPWQILDFDYELEQKATLVTECFRQAGLEPIEPVANPTKSTTAAPPTALTDHHEFFYRNKMEYSLYWDNSDQQIRLAFHARGTHTKIPITKSSLERPEIFAQAQNIVDQLNAKRAEARQFQSLMLRASQDGTVSGGLLVKGQPHPIFPTLTDHIAGRSYSYSPGGFFQINLPVYELALAHIAPYIKTRKVLDLYAGVGTIGLTVAADHELTLVESSPAAFRELEKNCKKLCNDTVRSGPQSRRGPSDEPLDDGREERPRTVLSHSPRPLFTKSEAALDFIQPDTTVILDPPRAGCDPKLVSRLLEQTPPTIIYLSCNPITQARDLARLIAKYQIINLTTFNFFPRTPHIENLAILETK